MNRRQFVTAIASSSIAPRPAGDVLTQTSRGPILDAHVHLFDPSRPGGVPWPEPTDLIYQPAFPERLQSLTAPLGVVGAIAIEASPLRSDNDWLLAAVTRSPFMVGMIGDLVPGDAAFRSDLERLHRSPLFLGIRYGNLWHRDLAVDRTKPNFLADVRVLAAAGLTFESANPTPSLLQAILAVAQQVPDLRIVIDHLPSLEPPREPGAHRAFVSTLQELAQNTHVYVKLSEVVTPRPGQVQSSSRPYRDRLDPLWDTFGENRILFGSDWPNSDHIASYSEVLSVAQDYVASRGLKSFPRVFLRNAQEAYRWQARTAAQGV